jgi:hypothetical protein
MKVRPILFTSCAALLVGTGISLAGPCSTAYKDAGSGPTPGNTAQATTGTASANSRSGEHPPTATMNQAAGSTSSQDAQRQMQGQPTAAQEAQGAKAKSGNDC